MNRVFYYECGKCIFIMRVINYLSPPDACGKCCSTDIRYIGELPKR